MIRTAGKPQTLSNNDTTIGASALAKNQNAANSEKTSKFEVAQQQSYNEVQKERALPDSEVRHRATRHRSPFQAWVLSCVHVV